MPELHKEEITVDWIKSMLPKGELFVRKDAKNKIQDAVYVTDEKFDVALWNLRAVTLRIKLGNGKYPILFAHNPGELRAYTKYSV